MYEYQKRLFGKEYRRKTIDYVHELCDGYLSQEISQKVESRILEIKNKSSKQIEKELTSHFFLLFVDFLERHKSLLKAQKTTFYIDLAHSNKYATWLEYDISSFSEVFLKIVIDNTLIKSYILGQQSIDNASFLHETLLHEFTICYDWVLASKDDYQLAKNAIGEEPLQETVIFTRVAKTLRYSGTAELNTLLRKSIRSKQYSVIWLNEEAEDYSKHEKRLAEFIVGVKKEPLSWVRKKEKELEKEFSTQFLGTHMSTIIFIDKFRDHARYFYTEDVNLRKNPFFVKNVNNVEELTPRGKGAWLSWQDAGKILLDAERDRQNKMLFLVANNDVLLKFSDDFVRLISLMNPDKFLDRYVESAKVLGLDPSPIKSGLIKEIDREKKEILKKGF